jgi:16S rRNA A1518/A1519 N6-dimethyltransferase RsmA/KsgA/DIM1 with predicted DNA glycosylase/AP lyase activity
VIHADALNLDYAALLQEHWVPPAMNSEPTQAQTPAQAVPPPALQRPVAPGLAAASAPHSAVHVLGNLPFGVATPLLMQFLAMAAKGQGLFAMGPATLTLAFQREVAERLVARPGAATRGRISAMAQHYCAIRPCFNILPASFTPPPQVDTSVVHLQTHADMTHCLPFEELERVCRSLFSLRRRRLRHGLAAFFPEKGMDAIDEIVKNLGLPPTAAPFELSNEQLYALCILLRESDTPAPSIALDGTSD